MIREPEDLPGYVTGVRETGGPDGGALDKRTPPKIKDEEAGYILKSIGT